MIGTRIANHFTFNIFRVFWCFVTPAIVIVIAQFKLLELFLVQQPVLIVCLISI